MELTFWVRPPLKRVVILYSYTKISTHCHLKIECNEAVHDFFQTCGFHAIIIQFPRPLCRQFFSSLPCRTFSGRPILPLRWISVEHTPWLFNTHGNSNNVLMITKHMLCSERHGYRNCEHAQQSSVVQAGCLDSCDVREPLS